MLLNDVYVKGEYPCNEENKKRLLEIFHAFPSEEPIRKRFTTEIVGWSGKFGDLERGDADIHHAVGKVYAEGKLLKPSVSRASLKYHTQKAKHTMPNDTWF